MGDMSHDEKMSDIDDDDDHERQGGPGQREQGMNDQLPGENLTITISDVAMSPRVSTVGTDDSLTTKHGAGKEASQFAQGAADYTAPGLDSLHWAGVKKRGDFDQRSIASSMNAEKDDKSVYEESYAGLGGEGTALEDVEEDRLVQHGEERRLHDVLGRNSVQSEISSVAMDGMVGVSVSLRVREDGEGVVLHIEEDAGKYRQMVEKSGVVGGDGDETSERCGVHEMPMDVSSVSPRSPAWNDAQGGGSDTGGEMGTDVTQQGGSERDNDGQMGMAASLTTMSITSQDVGSGAPHSEMGNAEDGNALSDQQQTTQGEEDGEGSKDGDHQRGTSEINQDDQKEALAINEIGASSMSAGPEAVKEGTEQKPAPSSAEEEQSGRSFNGLQKVDMGEEWESTFKGLLYEEGIDALGRPVVVLDADSVPPRMKSSAVTYVRTHLLPIVTSGEYVIVFTAKKAKLPTFWIMGAYQSLPRPFRKNVQYVILVRPSGFLRAILAFMRPFVSRKAGRKIKMVESLEEIGEATSGEVTKHHLGQSFLETDAAREM